jgi:hypothetical protein
MTKEHYFIVSGALDSDNNVHWHIDTDMEVNPPGPNMNVFDAETGEWEDVADYLDNDKEIMSDLKNRLLAYGDISWVQDK